MEHHRWWMASLKLGQADFGVQEHEHGMRAFKIFGEYDQVDAPNLVVIEVILRRCQLIDSHYEKKSRAQTNKDSTPGLTSDEAAYFSGSHRLTGEIMVSPDLTAWVSQETSRSRSSSVKRARHQNSRARMASEAGTGSGSASDLSRERRGQAPHSAAILEDRRRDGLPLCVGAAPAALEGAGSRPRLARKVQRRRLRADHRAAWAAEAADSLNGLAGYSKSEIRRAEALDAPVVHAAALDLLKESIARWGAPPRDLSVSEAPGRPRLRGQHCDRGPDGHGLAQLGGRRRPETAWDASSRRAR